MNYIKYLRIKERNLFVVTDKLRGKRNFESCFKVLYDKSYQLIDRLDPK